MMQKFNQLALQYKSYSKETNKKKNKKQKKKNPKTNIIQSISNITYKIKKYQYTITELKKEYDVYNDFNKLCKEFINISNQRTELLNKIQKNFVYSTLNIDDSNLNKKYDVLSKSNNKFFDIDNKIGENEDKINNFKKLVSLCIEDKYKDKYKNKYKNKYLCQVCYINKINTCLSNCGHTFCDECCKNMNNCPKCTSPVNIFNKIKMSIGDEINNDVTSIDGFNGSTLSTSLLVENDKNKKPIEILNFEPVNSIGFSSF